jgi:signal transduction histidine kinase/FixJ family two-component response regulator
MTRFLLLILLFFTFATVADHDIPEDHKALELSLLEIEAMEDKSAAVAALNVILENKVLTINALVDIKLKLKTLYFGLNQFDKSMQQVEEIEVLATQHNMPAALARANKFHGILFYYRAEYKGSVDYYVKSLKYYQSLEQNGGNLIQQANLHNNIALVQTSSNDFAGALDSYLVAQPIYELYGTEEDKSDVKGNIATLYIKLYKYEEAIVILVEVIDYRLSIGNPYGAAMATGDLGVSYKHLGNYKLAEQHLLSSLGYLQLNNNYYDIGSQLQNLAEVYILLGENINAENYASQSIEMSKKMKNMKSLANSYGTLSQAQFAQGRIEDAIINLNLSTELALTMPDKVLINHNATLMSLIKAQKGQYQQALLDLLESLQKSRIYSEEQLNSQLVEFGTSQLQLELDKLEQNKKLQEIKLAQENQRKNFILIAVFFVLLVLFLLYRRYLETQLTDRLEEKVIERTTELALLSESLVRANEIKNQFVANMSHEIRTPLTAVIGHTEGILYGDCKEDELTDEVKVIHDNSLHLLHIVNDVLDMSKIEENKLALSLSEVNIHTILNAIYTLFSKQAKRKGLSFELVCDIPDPCIVKVDNGRLKQILMNLCANAIKFTEKGKVTLSVEFSDSCIVFTIKDTGIGILEEQLDNVFDSFHQAVESISRRFGGTGLGLYISKQLAEMMNGSISVTSELDKGSIFVFNLPIQDAVDKPLVQKHEEVNNTLLGEAYAQYQGKIILAEDHLENRRFITRLLTKLGLEVLEASNGLEVLELWKVHQVNAIFMDIQMPEMDGVTALTELKALNYPAPIYALTANAMKHEVEQYLASGFEGHLRKPIEREKFVAIIDKHYPKVEVKQDDNEKVGGKGEDEEESFADLTAEFINKLPENKAIIEALYQQGDLQSLIKEVHKLAGAAYIFKSIELAECASDVEMSLKRHNKMDADLMDCLLDEINAARLNKIS